MSEYLLGHKKSPYYTKSEPERREIYAKSCERHLTYLDYSVIDKKLKDEQAELEALKAQMASQAEELSQYRIQSRELIEEAQAMQDLYLKLHPLVESIMKEKPKAPESQPSD